jgi:hypothetical protein
MNGWMSLALVWVSSLIGGLVGTIVGWLIGTFAPNYYVIVFDAAKEARFNPIQVGIGLGSTQGMLAGFFRRSRHYLHPRLARCEEISQTLIPEAPDALAVPRSEFRAR